MLSRTHTASVVSIADPPVNCMSRPENDTRRPVTSGFHCMLQPQRVLGVLGRPSGYPAPGRALARELEHIWNLVGLLVILDCELWPGVRHGLLPDLEQTPCSLSRGRSAGRWSTGTIHRTPNIKVPPTVPPCSRRETCIHTMEVLHRETFL